MYLYLKGLAPREKESLEVFSIKKCIFKSIPKNDMFIGTRPFGMEFPTIFPIIYKNPEVGFSHASK
ncbi:hypothetical protein DEM91_10105 [Prevotella sp. TCVGH]|nr:hypothetical protein [Prevotella sp. TCVGH]